MCRLSHCVLRNLILLPRTGAPVALFLLVLLFDAILLELLFFLSKRRTVSLSAWRCPPVLQDRLEGDDCLLSHVAGKM